MDVELISSWESAVNECVIWKGWRLEMAYEIPCNCSKTPLWGMGWAKTQCKVITSCVFPSVSKDPENLARPSPRAQLPWDSQADFLLLWGFFKAKVKPPEKKKFVVERGIDFSVVKDWLGCTWFLLLSERESQASPLVDLIYIVAV